MFDETIYARHIERKQAIQVHPVPDKITNPKGPFPEDLYKESEIIFAKEEEVPLGATAQNNFKPPKYLRCALCNVRVIEFEKDSHECEK